jgi:hypothetical protein
MPQRMSLADLRALEQQRRPRTAPPRKTAVDDPYVAQALRDLEHALRRCTGEAVPFALRDLDALKRHLNDVKAAAPE